MCFDFKRLISVEEIVNFHKINHLNVKGNLRMASGSAYSRGQIDVTDADLTYEWRIPDFFNLEDKEYISSPEFEYLGAKWQISLYRYGFWELFIRTESFSSVSLHRWAFVTVGIKKADGTVYKSESNKLSMVLGRHSVKTEGFLLPSNLMRDKMVIAPQDVVVVFCRISLNRNHHERILMNASIQTEISSSVYQLAEDFKGLHVKRSHYDVTIKVDNREFSAHRAILGARSPVFEAMFSHDTIERKTGIVEIQDCDPDVFQDFLLFLYSGKVQQLTSENVLHLYALADKYDVQDAKVEYVNFMAQNLCVDNICDFVVLAHRHNERGLMISAADFYMKHSKEIILSTKWQHLHKEYLIDFSEFRDRIP